MSELGSNSHEAFETLRLKGIEEAAAGRLDEALATCEKALEWARLEDHRQALDLAKCNRGSVLIALERGEEALRDLRTILMSSTDSMNRHLAAYNISLQYERRGDFERSRFYAGLALDHARRGSLQASYASRSHNQLANVLLAESYFGEARDHYEQALERLPESAELDRALILANLGYCRLTTEQIQQGLQALYTAWRSLRRLGAHAWESRSRIRLSLCYAHLELGRFDHARRHGTAALATAERLDDPEVVKLALYLLGETEKLAGERLRAYSYFTRLQSEFYSVDSQLSDLLMTMDSRNLLNLMA